MMVSYRPRGSVAKIELLGNVQYESDMISDLSQKSSKGPRPIGDHSLEFGE